MDKLVERFKAMSVGEKIIVIAGLFLFIVAFLPWYSISLGPLGSFTRSGWQSPGAIWSVFAVFIGLGMAGVVILRRLTDVKIDVVNRLLLQIQPGHLQLHIGAELSPDRLREARANVVRKALR